MFINWGVYVSLNCFFFTYLKVTTGFGYPGNCNRVPVPFDGYNAAKKLVGLPLQNGMLKCQISPISK